MKEEWTKGNPKPQTKNNKIEKLKKEIIISDNKRQGLKTNEDKTLNMLFHTLDKVNECVEQSNRQDEAILAVAEAIPQEWYGILKDTERILQIKEE